MVPNTARQAFRGLLDSDDHKPDTEEISVYLDNKFTLLEIVSGGNRVFALSLDALEEVTSSENDYAILPASLGVDSGLYGAAAGGGWEKLFEISDLNSSNVIFCRANNQSGSAIVATPHIPLPVDLSNTLLILIPDVDTDGEVTLDIGTGPKPILTLAGSELPAGALIASETYRIRDAGGSFRLFRLEVGDGFEAQAAAVEAGQAALNAITARKAAEQAANSVGFSNALNFGDYSASNNGRWELLSKWTLSSAFAFFSTVFHITKRGEADFYKVSVDGGVNGSLDVTSLAMRVTADQFSDGDVFLLVSDNAANTISLYYSRSSGHFSVRGMQRIHQQLSGDVAHEFAVVNVGTTEPVGDDSVRRDVSSFSLSSPLPAYFNDTVDISDFLDGSGSEASGAGNAAALQGLIDHLTANPNIKTVTAKRPSHVYRVSSGANQFFFPAGLRFMLDGVLLDWDFSFGTGSANLASFNNSHVEGLNVRLRNGTQFRRLFDFFSTEVNPSRLIDAVVKAETQINNISTAPLLDYGLRFFGDNNVIKSSLIENIDAGYFLYGTDPNAPSKGHRLSDVSAISYVTGLNVRNVDDTIVKSPVMHTRSPNALTDPGHNGIVHGSVRDYQLISPHIRDAGEHGVRFGGARSGEFDSSEITVSDAHIVRSGQCGIKFFAGVAGERFSRVNVVGVNIVDCQFEPNAPSEQPGFNDEGILAQQMNDSSFSGVNIHSKDNVNGYSCDCGFYGTGLTRVSLNGMNVSNAKRNSIRIDQYDGGQAAGSIEELSTSGFTASGIVSNNHEGDGIYLNFPTKDVRDISIEAELIGKGTGGTYAISGNGGAARYRQPCLFELKQRNHPAGLSALPGTTNIRTVDKFA